MRKIQNINEDWKFIKADVPVEDSADYDGERINLPHTWNAIDGQDGGNDYYRGKCLYVKDLTVPATEPNQRVYLEFEGVNSSAKVYLNNELLASHDGGYSSFKVDITPALKAKNILTVAVDNGRNTNVYPQKADFTFYGGIYRDVNMVIVPESHLELVHITPKIQGDKAEVTIKAHAEGEGLVRFTICGQGSKEAPIVGGIAEAALDISEVRLWDGRNDPFLYTAIVEIIQNGTAIDKKDYKFGCRTFDFDKDKGFLLNGKPYPLRGVSRHQDFKGVGNAITADMQNQDMDIILEMGATTIRLAHYQHSQYFYNLCDEKGMVVWAEIPYISEHLEDANPNAVSQLTELITENYNHPSIVCWGLSNEITAVGGESEPILKQHRILHNLAKKMDSTRPTVTANVFMLGIDAEILSIPDIISYNLYYGWYLGEPKDNDEFFDTFRAKFPNKIIGLSEYGADGNPKLQSPNPEKGDYTEGYQALYHEHMAKMIEERPYLWATHLWNMFDFAADGRDEGGEHGINQKGVVTFDRKIKKDSFYLYKAYWSKEPFIHLCGRRYIDRAEEITTVKVYSNCASVKLYADGKLFEEQQGNKVFIFKLPISNHHKVEAKYGELSDSISINKVSQPNPNYYMPQSDIVNWFDAEVNQQEGYFTLKNTLGEFYAVPEAAVLLTKLMDAAKEKRGDVAKGVTLNEAMIKAINATPLEKALLQIGNALDKDFVAGIVKTLCKIKLPS